MNRRRIATVVYGVFGLSVAIFVAYSILQVGAILFGSWPAAPGTAAQPLAPACASGLRSLLGAVDRASAASENAVDRDAAREGFKKALAPEWDRKDDVRYACEGDAQGLDAYAEALRLERLLEHDALRRAEETGPLRKRLEARIALERRPE